MESKKKQQQKKPKLIDTENRLVVARGGGREWGEWGEGGQKVQTSHYKVNKFWGSNVPHGDYR